MYKSAYKFGLCLMASLIVLSALAIPMGSMNNFQDVMASGKHSDRYDNSQEYDKSYYSDVHQYTPDYNYYYEPMKTQQQQSSYNIIYDDTKQISYNDSYEDMKTYSTYPTKDKKYVCQTGQFKGFFVESVEFCKLTIAQGPQGPIGPPGATGATGATGPQGERGLTGGTGEPGEDGMDGATGPRGFNGTDGINGTQGPPGPAGMTFINNTNTYFRDAVSRNITGTTPPFFTTALSQCESGDTILWRSFAQTNVNNPGILTQDNNLGNFGWLIVLKSDTEFPLFSLTILCFDNPPLLFP